MALGMDVAPLAHRIASILTPMIAPHYTGWLGVDMMLHTDSTGGTAVWPCVEINLRLTMGVLALYAAERALGSNGHGQLLVGRCAPPNSIDLSPTSGSVKYIVLPSS